uniref:Putative epoxide hydrolase n=1 Tax=Tolypocladium sp. CBMAI 1346 TaxID=2307036 RepID=A0A482DHJ3_9HYPO|nr:putative epoxide hydrolase [Tolypocladium sp. CBMAI 1346]
MAQHERGGAAAVLDEEIKPYKIHVSSKYLDLTRRKLELTRLPHDIPEPRSNAWWEPKPTAEPLIDYWLEQFSWRDQEQIFNANVPQFRTAIKTAASETPTRLHFMHYRSPHSNAIPLLLIPPFPFTNLALTHLADLFTNPHDAEAEQPFHLVVPALPGLGFSDPLTNKAGMVPAVAEMFDVLMKRLQYKHYLVTNSGPAATGLAHIDWKIANQISMHYPDSCLGVHLLSPPFSPPLFRNSPISWFKWQAASLLQSPILGYSKQDMNALNRDKRQRQSRGAGAALTPLGFGCDGAYEPNTLAYALCDSPLALLLFVLMVIRVANPKEDLSPADVIKITELTWLPGAEGTMRLWAHCASNERSHEPRATRKPRAAITVFLGDDAKVGGDIGVSDDSAVPRPIANAYSCPVWGSSQYDIVASSRVAGRPGLLAWERPDVIASGARALAKAILAVDRRLQPSDDPRTTLLEQVLVEGSETAPAETSGMTIQVSEGSARTGQQQAYETGLPRSDSSTTPMPIRPAAANKADKAEDANRQSQKPQERPGGNQESSENSPNTVVEVQVGA